MAPPSRGRHLAEVAQNTPHPLYDTEKNKEHALEIYFCLSILYKIQYFLINIH